MAYQTQPFQTILMIAVASLLLSGLTACSPTSITTETTTAHTNHTRMGSHGMAVIGDADLLFIHMALYRRPHDRQILIPAAFQSNNIQVEFNSWRASYRGLVSIVPENFDLDRLAPDAEKPLTSFSADIYEGHFERGGKLKFKNVMFRLDAPIFYRSVNEDILASETYTYLTHENAAYLLRHIGPRPDKDEILSVVPSPELRSGERLVKHVKAGNEIEQGFLKDDGTPVKVRSNKIVYCETADFSEIE